MASTCTCVLGQVYGNFDQADDYFFTADPGAASRLGFDTSPDGGRDDFRKLQRLWSFVIRQRQAVSQ